MGINLVILLFIIAYGALILIFLGRIKKCNALKTENDRLKDLIMKVQTRGTNKEQKLPEYQSIIDKIKNRYQDSKDEKKK